MLCKPLSHRYIYHIFPSYLNTTLLSSICYLHIYSFHSLQSDQYSCTYFQYFHDTNGLHGQSTFKRTLIKSITIRSGIVWNVRSQTECWALAMIPWHEIRKKSDNSSKTCITLIFTCLQTALVMSTGPCIYSQWLIPFLSHFPS